MAKSRDANAEARIQAAIVEWVRTVAPDVIVFHIPNGGLRTKKEAARFKWMGVLAGIPDLCVLTEKGYAYFMEVKTEKGSLSKDQRDTIASIRNLFFGVAIVRSIDDARLAFQAWNIPTREVR